MLGVRSRISRLSEMGNSSRILISRVGFFVTDGFALLRDLLLVWTPTDSICCSTDFDLDTSSLMLPLFWWDCFGLERVLPLYLWDTFGLSAVTWLILMTLLFKFDIFWFIECKLSSDVVGCGERRWDRVRGGSEVSDGDCTLDWNGVDFFNLLCVGVIW